MSLGKIVSGWASDLGKKMSEPATKESLSKGSSKSVALDRAKVSKDEIKAKYRDKQIAKHGGLDKFQKSLQDQRSSIKKAMSKYKEPSEHEKSEHQRKFKRAYND